MIKRRLDYEKFCRIKVDWIQLWQVGKKMYRVENIFTKQWWVDLYADWPRGKRFWAFRVTVRGMVKGYGESPTPEELSEQTERINIMMADIKKKMKEQGFDEFFDACQEWMNTTELFNNIFGTNLTPLDLDNIDEIWRNAMENSCPRCGVPV